MYHFLNVCVVCILLFRIISYSGLFDSFSGVFFVVPTLGGRTVDMCLSGPRGADSGPPLRPPGGPPSLEWHGATPHCGAATDPLKGLYIDPLLGGL